MSLNNGKLLVSTFSSGDLKLAVDALRVQEIIRVPQRTRVYLAPESVWGVINLRGRIVTVWDLRTFLGEEPCDLTEESRIIVLKFQEDSVGLLVDSIDDVMEINRESLQPTPGNVDQGRAGFILGVFGSGDHLISLLDLHALETGTKG